MATVVPSSELMKKAVRWVSEKVDEGMPLHQAVEQAGMQFNLGPKDAEFLRRTCSGQPE